VRVPALALLAVAIVCEVGATVSLRASDGFSRPLPIVGVVLGYGVSFVALSFALKRGIGLGTAYAIWSGVGTVLVAVLGYLLFGDRVGWLAILGMALVIAGVVVLNLGGAGH
jgi:small multidrug resistance pump